jgi:DNA-binding transcriptional MerR regulator
VADVAGFSPWYHHRHEGVHDRPTANAVGVPTSTIRFYERIGLFKPDARTGGNYRHYGEQSLDRLRFIGSAQTTGFSLEDIRRLLSLTHSDEPPCDDVLTLTTKRLAEVRERIKELRHVEKVLATSLTECCTGKSPGLCNKITRHYEGLLVKPGFLTRRAESRG